MSRTMRIAPSDPSPASLYTIWAPYAVTRDLRSALTLPGITSCTRYPLADPIKA